MTAPDRGPVPETKPADDGYDAADGDAGYCVFCPDPVPGDGAEAEITLMGDFVDTPVGTDTPGRRVVLCHKHATRLRDRATLTDDLVVR